MQDETSPQFIVVHSLQALFPFINLCIYIAIAAFQRYWGVGPSFMTALALLVSVGSFLFGLMFREYHLHFQNIPFVHGESPLIVLSIQSSSLSPTPDSISCVAWQDSSVKFESDLFLSRLKSSSISSWRQSNSPNNQRNADSHACRIIATVSANSGGCKNRSADPNAGKAGYTAAMDPFCRNKRAAAAFFWLTLSTSPRSLSNASLTP